METSLEGIIRFAFQIYTFMIFGYILMSWIPALKESALGEFLERVVEPYLRPFKQFIPPLGMIDVSPIVALFTLFFVEEGLIFVLELLTRGM
jgi:YggT family protein